VSHLRNIYIFLLEMDNWTQNFNSLFLISRSSEYNVLDISRNKKDAVLRHEIRQQGAIFNQIVCDFNCLLIINLYTCTNLYITACQTRILHRSLREMVHFPCAYNSGSEGFTKSSRRARKRTRGLSFIFRNAIEQITLKTTLGEKKLK